MKHKTYTISSFALASRHKVEVFAFIIITLIATVDWWSSTYNLDLRIAVGGFSPLHYIGTIFCPECFAGDSNLGDMFGVSFFSIIYEQAYSRGIPPYTTQLSIIFIETMLTAFAFYWGMRNIFSAPIDVSLTLVVIVMSSSALHLNMGGWRMPYFSGLPYAIPEALRLIAVLLFLINRPILSGVMLALAFAAHPVIGGMGLIFVAGMALASPRLLIQPRILAGGVISILLMLLWFLSRYSSDDLAGTTGLVSDQEWSTMNRMLNFHFFPDEQGHLTTRPDAIFLPWLSATLLVFHYMRRLGTLGERDKLMAGGFILAFVVCAFGIAFAYFDASPYLVRLTLVRASDLIAQFGVFYIALGLYRDIRYGSILRSFLAAIILISLFSFPRYPFLPIALLASGALIEGWYLRKIDTHLLFSSSLLVALVGLSVFYANSDLLIRPYSWYLLGSRPFLYQQWWIVGGSTAIALALVAFLISRLRGEHLHADSHHAFVFNRVGIYGVLMLFSGILVMGGHYIWDIRSFARPKPIIDWATDYKDAQIWAKNNTQPGTLFMPDPTIYYGWRDYSWRPSFGNMFEWLRQPLLYRVNEAAFIEGRKRFSEFDLNLDVYKAMGPEMKGYIALDKDLKERFYNMDSAWFAELAKKYGIHYTVLNKKLLKKTLAFQVAYENETFIILNLSHEGK